MKDGLYVIPGFDGNMSGGNVAMQVTDEGVIIDLSHDSRFAQFDVHNTSVSPSERIKIQISA